MFYLLKIKSFKTKMSSVARKAGQFGQFIHRSYVFIMRVKDV